MESTSRFESFEYMLISVVINSFFVCFCFDWSYILWVFSVVTFNIILHVFTLTRTKIENTADCLKG